MQKSLYHPIRIGSLELNGNLFLAPVAGYSDRAFRSLCIDEGASFTYTEMVSAEALVRNSGHTEQLLLRAENEQAYAVQLFGGDPQHLADAARLVLEKCGAECIDINAGCPVPKVCKSGSGATLTRDPDRLYKVLRAVVDRVRNIQKNPQDDRQKEPVPVTVKIRSGWDDSSLTWKEAAEAALSAGISAIALHPRTRTQGYAGKANHDILTSLVKYVHQKSPGVPVIGSGDLFSPEAAQMTLAETECDVVMFARGAIGNPFIFSQTKELLRAGSYAPISAEQQLAIGWKELNLLCTDTEETTACRMMRKRFCAYSKGLKGGAELRNKIVRAETIRDYRSILAGYCNL